MAGRVLITGASGFIGRHCVAELARRGYTVHAVARRLPPPTLPVDQGSAQLNQRVQWHRADLLAPGCADGLMRAIKPSHLLHLAWITTPGEYWQASANLTWTQASLELIRSFADHGGRRIVGVGTCAEYDWRFGYCREELTPLRPATLYGASKAGLFQILEAFTQVRDLSFTWGRIFYPYGPDEARERLLPSVINGLLREERVPCTDGSQIRDFLHVSDVAGALVALLDSAVTGAVNIGSGVPITVRQLVGLAADALGRSELIAWGALPQRLNEPPLLVADIRRLLHEVGWRPHYSLDAGLRQTIAWWQGQKEIETRPILPPGATIFVK